MALKVLNMIFWVLKMEAASNSEMLVTTSNAIWHENPENHSINIQQRFQ